MKYALLAMLALATPAGGAELRASLEAAADRPAGQPYPLAVLVVRNGLSRPIAWAALRLAGGEGPTVLVDLTVPAGTTARRRVPLPAVEPHQEYQLSLFEAGSGAPDPRAAPPLAQVSVPIDWPVQAVAGALIIRPGAYAAMGSPPPAWPVELRQQALIALAGMVVVAGFALLPAWPAARVLGMLAAVTAAGGLLAWLAQSPAAAGAQATAGRLVLRGADGAVFRESVLRLAARRTGTLDAGLADESLLPVYGDRAALQRDATLLILTGRGRQDQALARAPLERGQVQLLCGPGAVSGQAPTATAPADRVQAGTPPPAVRAAVGERANELLLTAGRAMGPCLLILGDRFTPVPALPGNRPLGIDLAADLPLRRLRETPGQYGLSAEAMSLLLWWDHLYRRADSPYLVWSGSFPARAWLQVTEVQTK